MTRESGILIPLSVKVTEHSLTISLDLGTMKWAAEHMDENNPYNESTGRFEQAWRITDKVQFAKDVRIALLDEAEDGSTPVTRILDAAFLAAIGNGSEGVTENK